MDKTFNGIDISEHNGNIDWQKVKNSGIDFAIIRAGYGINVVQKDSNFDRNITLAHRNGIAVGVYWSSHATNVDTIIKEAETCVSVIRRYKNIITMPVCLRFDNDSLNYAKVRNITIDKDIINDFIKHFYIVIKREGLTFAYFANKDTMQIIGSNNLLNENLWFSSCDNLQESSNSVIPRYNMGLWQYSTNGRVNGINGNVSMNIAFSKYKLNSIKNFNLANKNQRKPMQ